MRVVLSICALIVIAIAAPLAAHARTVDHASDLAPCDDGPADVPAIVATVDVPILACRPFVIVDLDRERDHGSFAHATLAFAPKTSPPAR